ncbi:MAG: hypothetical protein A2535_12915 [Burkholderiales bacterium RIFOXYD2_FULL_59_8]|nr:MAG: hypothetical protein A2496_15265 [Burkholderiales bacterium RIFOXYC12_FULL_60_6]OGB81951.1 MAG: hypothetical protein A2535_12915 [Burkholderiales bacterium RIFOXYD2_FULL_59_8]
MSGQAGASLARACGWYGQVMKTQIDHLVVVAQTLALGVQWCEATIGIIQTQSLLGYSVRT